PDLISEIVGVVAAVSLAGLGIQAPLPPFAAAGVRAIERTELPAGIGEPLIFRSHSEHGARIEIVQPAYRSSASAIGVRQCRTIGAQRQAILRPARRARNQQQAAETQTPCVHGPLHDSCTLVAVSVVRSVAALPGSGRNATT